MLPEARTKGKVGDKQMSVAFVQCAADESVIIEVKAESPSGPFEAPRRGKDVTSDDEQREVTDDESGNMWTWSPDKRRTGYVKLRNWFIELKRRLERSLKSENVTS